MKRNLKYFLVPIGIFIILLCITFGIMYVVNPNKVKRLLYFTISRGGVYVNRLRGYPYTKSKYDGIDVSKHNGIIKWEEVVKNKKIKFVYIKATEGSGHIDCLYRRNVRQAKKAGLKIGSYHFFTSQSAATTQFLYFSKVAKKNKQDLIPMLDIEEAGINGKWNGKQLQDSVWVFMKLAKKHYGKYPIIYSNESFYNKELGHGFNHLFLFIANYQRRPRLEGHGECNIWQYSERGHLSGIGEFVDLSCLQNGTAVKDLML